MKFASVSSMDVGNAVAQSVFNAARALFPPSTVVHLGAGSGIGELHQWRQWEDVPASLVVDAQANRLTWAQAWVKAGSGRLLSDATLSETDGRPASLVHTSNPDETGLIALPSLHRLWPQLRQTESTNCHTRSLDSLITEFAGAALSEDKNLWLLVDFFCAPDFWKGASKALARARVVVLRQTLKEVEGIESAEVAVRRMADLGYVRCASLESNHPEVVHVVYQRDLLKDLEATQTISLELTREREAQSRAKDEALAQRDQEAKAKEQARSQREALAQEKVELLAALEAQQRAKDQALAQRNQESKAKEQALSQREALAKEKVELLTALEAQQRAKDEALAQRHQEAKDKEQALFLRDALAQEKVELLASREAEAKARSELEGKLDAESSAKGVLTQELTALEARCTSIAAEKDAETKRKNELLAQRDILVQEKAGLAAAREFEMQAKLEAQSERDAKARLISEQSVEMERLRAEVVALHADLVDSQTRAQATENQNQSLYLRQDLLQDEMTKAEAQIDLIKDLLLREPRL